MARLGTTPARSLGRRLRSAAVIGLIVGAAGAFFPGGHAAHAAAMTTVTPAPIVGTIGVTVKNDSNSNTSGGSLTGGSLTVRVDGSTVTLSGTPSPNGSAMGGGTPGTAPFNPVNAPTIVAGDTTATTGTGLTFTSAQGNGTCAASQVTKIRLSVDEDGSDTLTVTCDTKSDQQVTLTLAISASGLPGNTPAATPELGSGELLATGLVPALGIVLYRRRRQRRAAK